MTANKNRTWIDAFGNHSARGFNFFPPLALRLLGTFGNAPINSPRTFDIESFELSISFKKPKTVSIVFYTFETDEKKHTRHIISRFIYDGGHP
jgi:hypothetical protein